MPSFDNLVAATPSWQQCTTPRNGNKFNQENWLDYTQRLANRDAYLQRLVAPEHVYLPILNSSHPDAAETPNLYWQENTQYGYVSTSGSDGAGAPATILFELLGTPSYFYLSELRLTIGSPATYAGTPQHMTTFSLYQRNPSAGAVNPTEIGSTSDPATYGGNPGMNATRDLVLDLSFEGGFPINKSTQCYFIVIHSEWGSNARAGQRILSLRATIAQPSPL
jgi:hypothetical protein